MRRSIYSAVLVTAMLVIGTSCRHKDLCYSHPHTLYVNVVFDWRYAPEASPASMSLYMFPDDGSEVERYEFIGKDGGTIRIAAGSYEALCLNSDTENVSYRSEHLRESDAFEITTPTTNMLSALSRFGVSDEGAPRVADAESERVVLQPDMLWTDYEEVVELIQTDEVQTIVLYPKIATTRCTVEIRGAQNLEYVYGISGTLTSMAGGMFPKDVRLNEELVTIPYDVKISDDKSYVTAELYTFGHCPDDMDNTHNIQIYAVMSDGSKQCVTYDVTDQVHEAPDQRNIHILLEGLPLNRPEGGEGGGFQVSVEDWQTTYIDITM